MTNASSTVSIDDARIRVTTWTFQVPGDSTGPHRHEFDYLVVPITGGTLTVATPDGEQREMTQRVGSPYLGSRGTTHTVTATTSAPVSFVEVEFKT